MKVYTCELIITGAIATQLYVMHIFIQQHQKTFTFLLNGEQIDFVFTQVVISPSKWKQEWSGWIPSQNHLTNFLGNLGTS